MLPFLFICTNTFLLPKESIFFFIISHYTEKVILQIILFEFKITKVIENQVKKKIKRSIKHPIMLATNHLTIEQNVQYKQCMLIE